MRIVSRELLSMLGILLVMMLEDPISKTIHIVHWSSVRRAAVLLAIAAGAQLVGYVVGAFLGSWIEACCHCCGKRRANNASNDIQEGPANA